MSRVFVSPRVIYGRGTLAHLASLPARRTALIADSTLERLGLAAQAEQHLGAGGSESRLVGRVDHEPCVDDVPPLVAALKDFAPERIVALGGGSVLDAAKAAWAFYQRPGLAWADALGVNRLPQAAVEAELVAVPTTSGTGSEVSSVTVLIDGETRLKRLIIDGGIVPSLAIVDPALTDSLPPRLTALSAVDAVTHAVEAMVAALANPFSTALALRALRLIFEHLPGACNGGGEAARDALHLAATLAGLAATNSTAGLAHGMDQVGPLFNLPHGLVCAVLLPHTVAFNLEAAVGEYAEMGAALGAAGEELDRARGFVRALVRLERAVGLPLGFAAAGVAREAYERQLPVLVQAALESRSSQLSPRLPSAAEAERLFIQAYEGSLPEWVTA